MTRTPDYMPATLDYLRVEIIADNHAVHIDATSPEMLGQWIWDLAGRGLFANQRPLERATILPLWRFDR